jgi:hypothetical protein
VESAIPYSLCFGLISLDAAVNCMRTMDTKKSAQRDPRIPTERSVVRSQESRSQRAEGWE